MELLLFIFISVGIIVIPGPNVLVIISTSISHGRVRGLQTVAGTSAAMAIQLVVAALGTSYFLSVLTQGFLWLKWAGVIYLGYLGIKHLAEAFRASKTSLTISPVGSFQRGFWVSLTNPKTILFFSAFLPQFVTQSSSYMPQIILLSALFWVLAVMLDSTYAFLASKLASLIHTENLHQYQNGIIGFIYCGACSWLASIKNA